MSDKVIQIKDSLGDKLYAQERIYNLSSNDDLNNIVLTSDKQYAIYSWDANAATPKNAPLAYETGYLEVFRSNSNFIYQRVTTYKDNVFIRRYYSAAGWADWKLISPPDKESYSVSTSYGTINYHILGKVVQVIIKDLKPFPAGEFSLGTIPEKARCNDMAYDFIQNRPDSPVLRILFSGSSLKAYNYGPETTTVLNSWFNFTYIVN